MAKNTTRLNREILNNRAYLRAYLQRRLRQGPKAFCAALREVALLHEGGVRNLARLTGLSPADIRVALSEKRSASYVAISQIVSAMGLDAELIRGGRLGHKRRMLANKKKGSVTEAGYYAGSVGGFIVSDKAEQPPKAARIMPGSAKGMTYYMADDFDAPLAEFSDYM